MRVFMLLFALLFSSLSWATTKVEVLDAWPPGEDVALYGGQTYYLHLAYETDEAAGIWVRAMHQGERVQQVGSSGSPRYVGKGETMVWLFVQQPGVVIDEVQLIAGDGRLGMPVVATWPVNLRAYAGQASSAEPPAWVAAMEANRKTASANQPPAPPIGGLAVFLSVSMFLILGLLALFGLAAPWWGIKQWQGWWRLLAWLPLLALGLTVLNIAVGVMIDPTSHNLFPFEILMVAAPCGAWMLLMFIARWLTRKKRPSQKLA